MSIDKVKDEFIKWLSKETGEPEHLVMLMQSVYIDPEKLWKFYSQAEARGYVKGYKEGSGDLGTRTTAEYLGFEEKLKEAEARGRESERERIAKDLFTEAGVAHAKTGEWVVTSVFLGRYFKDLLTKLGED